tara:strand:- start:680 stop:1348 length:669 start_codon:yes stop_codon:yes gene_type:complete
MTKMETYHKIQTVWLRDPENKYKTLLEGVWSKPEFEFLAGNMWQFTEKIDGMNMRIYIPFLDNYEHVRIGGRTDNAQIPTPLLEWLSDNMSDEFVKEKRGDHEPDLYLGGELVFYGEGFGGKIQKGSKYSPDQTFILFDIMRNNHFIERAEMLEIADHFGLRTAKLMAECPLEDGIEIVRKGEVYSEFGEFEAEGLVGRPVVELTNRYGERVITKIKAKDFA